MLLDPYIFTAFNNPKLRKFNHTITINKVAITEFRPKLLQYRLDIICNGYLVSNILHNT